MMHSAWWGKSFVSDLKRVSEPASKTLKVRRGSIAEANDDAVSAWMDNLSVADTGGNADATATKSVENGAIVRHDLKT